MRRSFARIGSAYTKKGEYALAIKNLEKSLTEHRTPDTLAKLKEAEKAKSDADKAAYLDPALSDKAREDGNTSFKAGDFATSVKHYSEAIKRNPSDPRGYTNRAAAYSKLLALPEALKDANSAIAADPSFIKAYLRKSITLLAMKDSNKALEALREAEEKDTEGKHKKEIQGQMQKCIVAEYGDRENETDEQRLERAMRDPEVQQIMSDVSSLPRSAFVLQLLTRNDAARHAIHPPTSPIRPRRAAEPPRQPDDQAKDHEARAGWHRQDGTAVRTSAGGCGTPPGRWKTGWTEGSSCLKGTPQASSLFAIALPCYLPSGPRRPAQRA